MINNTNEVSLVINKNDIVTSQAKSENVALIRARERTCEKAKIAQGFFVCFSIALPIASVTVAAAQPDIKPYIAFFGILLLLLDVGVLERFQKDLTKQGARLQEQFDTCVLQLPWNNFVAGGRVEMEIVRRLSEEMLSPSREEQISNWYDENLSHVRIEYARLICQRANIGYDMSIRRSYGKSLLAFSIGLILLLLGIGLAADLKFSEILTAIAIPLTPVLNWTLREYRRQTDTANSLFNLKKEFDSLWQSALDSKGAENVEIARQLQDAIYLHRASSSLIFDWVYYLLRSRGEKDSSFVVKKMIAEINQ